MRPPVEPLEAGSSNKQAEASGSTHEDTNVVLLVSNPKLESRTVTSFVETTTPVLPGLDLKQQPPPARAARRIRYAFDIAIRQHPLALAYR